MFEEISKGFVAFFGISSRQHKYPNDPGLNQRDFMWLKIYKLKLNLKYFAV